MIGDSTFQPYAINTFSRNGKAFAAYTPIHYVRPHIVRSHFRNGTFIPEYWRDGDGNTNINRDTGYYARNPNAIPTVVRLSKKLFFK